jgi:cytochrome oxidase assembly protein ShyY1
MTDSKHVSMQRGYVRQKKHAAMCNANANAMQLTEVTGRRQCRRRTENAMQLNKPKKKKDQKRTTRLCAVEW